MAKSELLIPFIFAHEAGINLDYARRVNLHTLVYKSRASGFSNDPLDRGGATFAGITLATYSDFCRRKGLPTPTKADLQGMPSEHWGEIFRTAYWDRWQADLIPSQRVANILVDFVWASGIHGVKVPQRVLGVTPDGIVGPKTLDALLRAIQADEEGLVQRLVKARLDFVDRIVARDPSQKRFINGWKKRITSLAAYFTALSLPMLLLSCGAPRRAVVAAEPVTLHASDSLRTDRVSVTRLDTLTVSVTLPRQGVDRLTTDSISTLETDHALSRAWIDPDGRLGHSLSTKPEPLVTRVVVPHTSDTLTRTLTRIRDVPIPVPTYVNAPLTRWQQWRLDAFWWLAAILAALLSWKLIPRFRLGFRKIFKSLRYLCCYLM